MVWDLVPRRERGYYLGPQKAYHWENHSPRAHLFHRLGQVTGQTVNAFQELQALVVGKSFVEIVGAAFGFSNGGERGERVATVSSPSSRARGATLAHIF